MAAKVASETSRGFLANKRRKMPNSTHQFNDTSSVPLDYYNILSVSSFNDTFLEIVSFKVSHGGITLNDEFGRKR
jgi:hypothetical protein